MQKLLLILLAAWCMAPCASAASLPRSVELALRQAQIPLAHVGVEVREVNARTPLISLNARQAMNPASTMKLLTTYAGLEMLGLAYTWKTEAYLDGELKQGVLKGNLILKGYGDPKFTLEQFWLWLHELRGRGLREIRGNLVLDRSAFELPPHDPAAFDNEPIRPYNMGPDALLFNFNAVRLRFIPDGEKIILASEPNIGGLALDNRIVVVSPAEPGTDAQSSCDYWDDAISTQLDGDVLLVQGNYPAECGEREKYVSVLPPSRYLGAVFRTFWQEMGGALEGESVEGVVPDNAVLLSTRHSAPLSELIRDINKFSNNVMARQLFLSLGNGVAEADGQTAKSSFLRSELAVRDWLAGKKLHFPELILENGAGLSRLERISPRNLALLLQSAQRSPLGAEFEASLPIVGVDGTLKKRLNNSVTAAHAHLKSGSLKGVQALAGYVQARSGKQWIVVFLIGHPNAGAGQQAQDKLIEWIQSKH